MIFADGNGWLTWFLRLSGWPVFLVIVAGTFGFMLLATMVLTWASNRSVAQNIVFGVLAVAAVGFLLLAVVSLLSRAR